MVEFRQVIFEFLGPDGVVVRSEQGGVRSVQEGEAFAAVGLWNCQTLETRLTTRWRLRDPATGEVLAQSWSDAGDAE